MAPFKLHVLRTVEDIIDTPTLAHMSSPSRRRVMKSPYDRIAHEVSEK